MWLCKQIAALIAQVSNWFPEENVAKFSCRAARALLSNSTDLKKRIVISLGNCRPKLQQNINKIKEQVCWTEEADPTFTILSNSFHDLLLPHQLPSSACLDALPSISFIFLGSRCPPELRSLSLADPFLSEGSWDDVEDLIPSDSRSEITEKIKWLLSLRAEWTSDFSFLANVMFIRLEADLGSWFFLCFPFFFF